MVRKALLGALGIFNSSNRQSINVGDPWRDRIIETLREAAGVLVLCSPDSVASPWVNFESGGAWVAGVRVIPCCIKGMETTSLPAPLSHLQAINLASADDLRFLIKHLADVAGLDEPGDFDYEEAALLLSNTWNQVPKKKDNSDLIQLYERGKRRPNKYQGETAKGFFSVSHFSSTSPQETRQFRGAGLTAGDSISLWIKIEGLSSTVFHGFANSKVADFLESLPKDTLLHGTVKCLGQIKVYDFDMPLEDDERGVSYYAAWLILDAKEI